uniref:tRNA(Ile)-lysidine synthase n=1 Tax=Phyllymenia taiwanensis TaxID=1260292 RepID=R9XY27_9FLOR|nr:tRNA(Ile)-lysidine synthase [Grateloupia taiwanensis]AGO19924.1 tRNA(Ile)-lysidine synthase [Grateloupia taiwanensis]
MNSKFNYLKILCKAIFKFKIMNTYLHQKFNKQIKRIQPLGNILVAISGGQDSLCLIKLIEDFKQKQNFSGTIEYIYIDHQWREDSKQQVKHLINYIHKQSIKIAVYEIKKIIYSELEARQIRYQIIIKHAISNDYSTLLTAHTETDRIETFFQQLIRGTSLDGVTSLKYYRQLKPNLKLVRPLISIYRKDINWFCRKFCLPIWSDNTNYQYSITRNRLRYELLPYLKQYFMLNIENNISKFINISNQDNEYIKQNAIKLYLISRHKTNIALNYLLIRKQHYAIQARTLEIFFYHHFNKPLHYNTLIQIINLMQKEPIDHQILKWHHLIINIHNNWIYIN